MSILIPGMEMPVCHFKTSESYNVHGFWMVYPDGKSKLHIMVGSDYLVCEAVHVPPHGRLGDMDAIARKIRRFGDYVDFTKDEIAGWFENGDFETIIPADLAEEGEG